MPTPTAMGGGLCGLWMAMSKADYVFYVQNTSPPHEQHIVFHEIGHVLRRHEPKRVLSADIARLLAPAVEHRDVQRVLGRDTYIPVTTNTKRTNRHAHPAQGGSVVHGHFGSG